MKIFLAAVAILTAALSFKVGMRMSEADAHVAPAALSYLSRTAPTPPVPGPHVTPRPSRAVRARRSEPAPYSRATIDALNDVVDAYCIDCHSNDLKLGNLSLEGFDIGRADTARVKAEKMVRKLRAEMMPLAGRPRPPARRRIAAPLSERADPPTAARPRSADSDPAR